MLNVLRQNANNWFMILLFAIITIVFVFTFGSWGGGDVSGEMPVAAKVNGRIISQAQFQALYSNTFRNMQMFRQGYTVDDAKREKLRETVLDRLVGTELLAQEADRRGIRISDAEVVEAVKKRYFRDRDFDPEEYKRIVNGLFQTNEARFEEQIRRELMGQRLEEVLTESQQVSPAEVKDVFNARYNRANLEVLRIDPGFYKDEASKPSEEEVKAWADKNGTEIEKFYNEHINRYRKPKQVRARHILVKVGAEASDDDKKKAREKIEAAKKRLDAGEDFATVAKEVGEDAAAAKGGDLGFFAKGTMIGGAFEEAAFSLKAGETSGVIESPQGLHILKVEEIKEESIKKLDEVKLEIAAQLMRDTLAESKARAVAEKAINDLKGGAAFADLKIEGFEGSLTEPGEDRLAPRVEETGWFNQNARYVPRVGISDEVVAAAFALTEDKPLPEKVYEVTGRFYVIKLKERERPDDSKFEAEREGIESSLLGQRRQRVVEQFLEQLKEDAIVERSDKVLNYGS